VARIGPVYTPPHERGRGYGTAITHALAEALSRECAIVMLYTDAANAISNGIYEQLGFTVVADWVEVTLAVGPASVTGSAGAGPRSS
jgi:predicted GNAT family acetyltransferase